MARITYTTQVSGPESGLDFTNASIFSTVLNSAITVRTSTDLGWVGAFGTDTWRGDVLGTGIVSVLKAGGLLKDVTAGHLTGLHSVALTSALSTDITVTNLNADASHLFDLVFAQAWVPLLAYITRGADMIFGAQGNDSINAGAGGDHVYGGGGADVIKGQTGGDALFGGAGNDILIGGNGSDTLTGGLGADKFDFAVLADATGADRIADFKHGVDHFVLHAATIAGIGGPGPLDPSHFSGVAITPATVILYDQATGWISYDADGSGLGGAWASIHVANGTVLDASDFLVV